MKTKSNSNIAFVLGYQFGSQSNRELTRQEIESAHPEFSYTDCERFIQGNIDGIMGDSYRYDMIVRHPKYTSA